MDGTPPVFRRLRSTIFWLGAGFLLVKNSRVLLERLQFLSGSCKVGMEPTNDAPRLASVAVLIDGENISSPQVERVVGLALNEAKKLGEVSVRRVYGNCSLFNQANNIWNDIGLRLELEQIHLARPTVNKNTADIALAINAIELAKDGTCNCFCLVTSDSDFTPLVRRLRELKCQVIGVGDKRTPVALVKACNRFIFTDRPNDTPSTEPGTPLSNTRPQPPAAPVNKVSSVTQPAPSEQQPAENSSQTVIHTLTGAYLDAARVRGDWVLLSRLGLSLRRLYPGFKATAYAIDLSTLIQQYPDVFDFEKRPNGHPQMRLKH